MINETKNRDIEFSILENTTFLVGIPPKGFYTEFINKIVKIGESKE